MSANFSNTWKSQKSHLRQCKLKANGPVVLRSKSLKHVKARFEA